MQSQWMPHYDEPFGEIDEKSIQKILSVIAASLDRIP